MNPIRIIRRLASALAGLACAWLGLAVAAPAAFAAVRVPPPGSGPPGIAVLHEPPGWNKHPPVLPGHVVVPVLGPNRAGYPPVSHVHTVVVGGMPGWQIALIAIGTALLAATAAVLAYRAWTARRKPVTAAPEPSAAGADVLSVP
jgi:hypothetical protein